MKAQAPIGAVGSGRRYEVQALHAASAVEAFVDIAHPFKLVSRSFILFASVNE